MEDDIDIYEDLPSFEAKYDGNYGQIQEGEVAREHGQLKSEIANLTVKLEELRKVNENLEVNLSSLLKTAKAEIARKDRMIEDLRRELKDASFRRGTYARSAACAAHRHFQQQEQRAIAGERTDFPPRNSCAKPKYVDADSSNDESEDKKLQNNFNRVPTTVFGERLRKKIEEERSAAERERQLGKFTSDGNSNESVEGYVVESDKENSSRRNIPDREKQSGPVTREPIPIVDDAILLGNSAEECPGDEKSNALDSWRRAALTTKCNLKRVNGEIDDGIVVKRVKTIKKENDVTTKDNDLDREYVAPRNFSKYDDFRHYEHPSKKQHGSTRLNPERVLDSHQREKHGCLAVAISRKGRSESRERNSFSYARRGTNGHATRHDKFTEKSKVVADEGSTNDRRYNENSSNFRRDDCRRNDFDYVGSHRTNKQRDDHRDKRTAFDNRSRKTASSDTRYREGRHKTDRLDRHAINCSGKEDALYDWRTHDTDKLKIVNKESYVSRNTKKRLADRKSGTDDAELCESTKYPRDKSRKISSTFKPGTGERRSDNSEERSHSSGTDKLLARSKISEKSREEKRARDVRKNDKIEQERVDGKDSKDFETDECTRTEDCKISQTLDFGLVKTEKDDSKDGQSIEVQCTSTIDEKSGTTPFEDLGKIENEKVEVVEAVAVSAITLDGYTVVRSNVSPTFSTEERIENIEKFIRGYTFDRDTRTDQTTQKIGGQEPVVGIPEAPNVESLNGDADETLSKNDETNGRVSSVSANKITTDDSPNDFVKTNDVKERSKNRIRDTNEAIVPEVTPDEDSVRIEGRENNVVENAKREEKLSHAYARTCVEDERISVMEKGCIEAEGDACLRKDEPGNEVIESPCDGNLLLASSEFDVGKEKIVRKVNMQRAEATLNVHGKVMVVARRRKNPVRLVDNNANMTIVMHPSHAISTSPDASCLPENSSVLKPRACKNSRLHKNS